VHDQVRQGTIDISAERGAYRAFSDGTLRGASVLKGRI